MRLETAINSIHAPQGVTTLISGLLSGDFDSVFHKDAVGKSLGEVEDMLAGVRRQQRDCASDAAWWGYNGEIAYLAAVRDLLKAAEITGPDNLPDVDIPDLSAGIVMDLQAKVTRFGAEVLKQAKALAQEAVNERS